MLDDDDAAAAVDDDDVDESDKRDNSGEEFDNTKSDGFNDLEADVLHKDDSLCLRKRCILSIFFSSNHGWLFLSNIQ